jgi:hypothetical protein
MKTSIKLLIILLLTFSYSYSQNDELDRRNGFKTIKLGTHYNKFTGLEDIKPSKETTHLLSNEIRAYYEPNDDNLKYLFGYKIDFIALNFDKKTKRLIVIELYLFNKKSDNDFKEFNDINDKFSIVLGDSDDSKVTSKMWYGKKVALGLTVGYDSSDKDNILTTKKVSFISLDSIKNNAEYGF